MKNVYSNKELVHIWANEKQESARGSNMFFENGIIYSYGKHFPIAKIYHNKRGKFILMTIKGYSNTTAKHKSYVSGAVNDPCALVYNVDIDTQGEKSLVQFHHDNLNELKARIDDLIQKAGRSTTQGEYKLASASNFILQYMRYIDFFKPSLLAVHKKAYSLMGINQYIPKELIEKIKAQESQAQEARIKREAREIEEEKIDLALWINGEDKRRYFHTCALRIKDNEVQTTLVARVPLDEARKLALMIKNKENVIGYEINGYTVISINGTLKIGCHNIPIEEVNRVIELLLK